MRDAPCASGWKPFARPPGSPRNRAPDEHFSTLPGFPYAPHYLEQDGLPMHSVDEGEGEPGIARARGAGWSHLYRKVIAGSKGPRAPSTVVVHDFQDDAGEALGERIAAWLKSGKSV